MRRIYVASSWRNPRQPGVVKVLREAGHLTYDFRDPPSGGWPTSEPDSHGFAWSEIDPQWQAWNPAGFRAALDHPAAVDGFRNDRLAMAHANTCVLVLPSGRSAHLEAGYFAGAVGKQLLILLAPDEPELMYKMATRLCVDLDELINALAEPISMGRAYGSGSGWHRRAVHRERRQQHQLD